MSDNKTEKLRDVVTSAKRELCTAFEKLINAQMDFQDSQPDWIQHKQVELASDILLGLAFHCDANNPKYDDPVDACINELHRSIEGLAGRKV